MGRPVTRAAGAALAVLLVAGCARTGTPPPTASPDPLGTAPSGEAMLARVDPTAAPGGVDSTTALPATTSIVPATTSVTAATTSAVTVAGPADTTLPQDDRPQAGATAAVPAAVVPFPTTAVTGGDERAVVDFATLVNALRASNGAARLTPDPDLAASAAAQVAAMMAAGDLFHQDLQDELDRGWSVAGENVGFGPGVTAVHNALVGSPGHFANLVNARFTHVGIAVRTDGNGRLWVAQVFGG